MEFKRVIGPALILVLLATLLIQLPLAIADRSSDYEWFDPIVDVRRILMDRYVEEPDEETMQQAMIDAMIEALDDPYTQFIPPAATQEFNKQLHGTYAGIGAEVNIVDGYLVIVSPMDDSPALRGGVMAGDTVLEIEGESTFELGVAECVERLTGEIGTPVTIRVRHLDGVEEDLTLVRQRIVTETVKGVRRDGEAWIYCLDSEIGVNYIRVTQFNANTVEELRKVLDDLHSEGMGGLILDLRDNPGGGLPAAVGMADLFIGEGVIVSVRPRVGEEIVYRSRAEGTLPETPMVVLVNGNSASASEIVAGALQQAGRAKVVGTRSFGKGSVQEVRGLSYGSGTLKFTTAHYYLPNGHNLHRTPSRDAWGVDPDSGFVVPITDEEYLEAFRARREFEIIRESDDPVDSCVPQDWVRENLRDEQLAVAVDALRERVVTGTWTPVTEEDGGELAFSQELRRASAARVRLLGDLRRLDDRIRDMRTRSEATGRTPVLSDEVDLTDATIAITDEAGATVGTFRVESGDLRRALEALSLTPLEK